MIKNKAKEIADSTLAIIEAGEYTAPSGSIITTRFKNDDCITKSCLYLDTDVTIEKAFFVKNINPKISVLSESILETSCRLQLDNAVALNFANATIPGGGFELGAIAQEETICRSSYLHLTLQRHSNFYDLNKESIINGNYFYLSNMIYSQNVLIFKNDNGDLLENPYYCSFITSPAPMRFAMENFGCAENELNDKLNIIFTERIRKLLKIAIKNGHRTIILGAWGCGAFGNDPFMVSNIFYNVLKELPYFDNIVFSIFTNTHKENDLNYTCFRDLFERENNG